MSFSQMFCGAMRLLLVPVAEGLSFYHMRRERQLPRRESLASCRGQGSLGRGLLIPWWWHLTPDGGFVTGRGASSPQQPCSKGSSGC